MPTGLVVHCETSAAPRAAVSGIAISAQAPSKSYRLLTLLAQRKRFLIVKQLAGIVTA
jgi:hypothetical protein